MSTPSDSVNLYSAFEIVTANSQATVFVSNFSVLRSSSHKKGGINKTFFIVEEQLYIDTTSGKIAPGKQNH